jgi:glutamate dehydrogenase
MSNAPAETVTDVIAEVGALAAERLPEEQRRLVGSFIERYYSGTAVEDLREYAVGDLFGAALAHWNLARQRQPGTPRLRVYNPAPQEHGWQSTHTILEIVSDDMPFLVDSVRLAINRLGARIHLVVHPVIRVRRDDDGRMLEVLRAVDQADGTLLESVMQIALDRHTDAEFLDEVARAVESVLVDVRLTVDDWQSMRGQLRAVLDQLAESPPPLEAKELEAGRAFLEWLDDDHFTFLGYRTYELREEHGEDVLRSTKGSSLGILRRSDDGGVSASFAMLSPEVRRLARTPELLIVTKANSRSTVHRRSYMDHIGVRRFDAEGRVIGEHRFLGLFTSSAYNRSPRDIPLLREKLLAVNDRAGYPRGSHAAKALAHILESYPRDELFQIDVPRLLDAALGILHLQERQRIRLFLDVDRYGRFCSCIVFVPRERFNTQLREIFQKILTEELGAEDFEFNVSLAESVLARLDFKLRLRAGAAPTIDAARLEMRLREAARAWSDDLYAALVERHGEERGTSLLRRYERAFGSGYRETYDARLAVHDIDRMETLVDENDLAMSLFRSMELGDDELELKLYRVGNPIPLYDVLPMLEKMGLKVVDERPSKIKRSGSPRVWIHDFGMRHSEPAGLDIDRVRDKFQEAFAHIWHGDAESDGFNHLVLRAGLSWREIVMLRACCKYLRQAGVTFSQEYMEKALAANPAIAAMLVELFHARLDPARDDDRVAAAAALTGEIQLALDAVANLDEDRILRSFLDIVSAVLRTNYYQHAEAGTPKSYLSLKLDPKVIPELPEPRPMFEIFVYSPQVEGVHLRGGTAARGGLRWSDRREDFRTEVLGLMKAQMVKNAVIVPVGSKGGFVPKQLPAGDREAILAEGQSSYRTFIRGLLDVTDNLVDGTVAPPQDVVRHDADDPYLVVAADKGTATFSDIANAIAAEYGFWLGDAFASGGSQGYDHKRMGITARGAWESVKRHFRELGLDTQTTPFTVMGIGDMSGDVFGNGMLLSDKIELIGAFNHLHVFIDPEPDPAASHAERQRLFALPRSTWDDYDRSVMSQGGGVFARSAKSISLSPQARAVLGIEQERLTPNDLVHAMLAAPVDLLWNGGIGTYVKSSTEHHEDAGDRANDAVRVDAVDLRARVVGEGGNLGLTQRGRIEAALHGVRVNTDAIDNAGGVDCSDHEVNIKILLNRVVAAGDLTQKQRNTLLAEMTDEVAELVLRDNYLQTQALSLAVSQAASMLDVHARLIRGLEQAGEINRELEFLPGKETLDERAAAGRGLTAPELAVLMAYVKIALFRDLVDSGFAADPSLDHELREYFPTALRERYSDDMRGHQLCAEIVCTVIANEMVNRCGMTFVFRIGEETGADAAEIARAYLIARDSFGIEGISAEIEALDNVATANAQLAMLLETRKLIERAARWLLRNRPRPLDMNSNVATLRAPIEAIAADLTGLVSSFGRERIEKLAQAYVRDYVPELLARRVAGFGERYSALDIAEIVISTGVPVERAASVYYAVGAELGLEWMREQIVGLPRSNRWQTLARAALRDELYEQARNITAEVLRATDAAEEPAERLEGWLARNGAAVTRVRQVMADLQASGTTDFTMLSVAMREVRGMRPPGISATPRGEPAREAKAPARRKRVAKRKAG